MEIIHIVLGKANPDRMNGVNKVVFQLATKQAESGRKVTVWGITKDPIKNFPDRNFETVLFPLESGHHCPCRQSSLPHSWILGFYVLGSSPHLKKI